MSRSSFDFAVAVLTREQTAIVFDEGRNVQRIEKRMSDNEKDGGMTCYHFVRARDEREAEREALHDHGFVRSKQTCALFSEKAKRIFEANRTKPVDAAKAWQPGCAVHVRLDDGDVFLATFTRWMASGAGVIVRMAEGDMAFDTKSDGTGFKNGLWTTDAAEQRRAEFGLNYTLLLASAS